MARRVRRVPARQWRHRGPGDIIDLRGQRFGRLTAVRFVRSDDLGRSIWHCVCDCTRTKEVRVDFLRNGSTKSCGCLRQHMPPLELAAIATDAVEEHW